MSEESKDVLKWRYAKEAGTSPRLDVRGDIARYNDGYDKIQWNPTKTEAATPDLGAGSTGDVGAGSTGDLGEAS